MRFRLASSAIVVVLAARTLPGCHGAGSACRDSADCSGGAACAGPDDDPQCGIPPEQACASTSDCAKDEVCGSVFDACSASGLGSECTPACTAASCAAGLRCGAARACEPVPCDEGFVCRANQRCDATVAHAVGPVYSATQGCVSIACASDAACPSGTVCVNAICQSGVGTCRIEEAVP
jgi:hypothetical protein